MSVIITPENQKSAPEVAQVEQLTKHEAERMLGAFARLHELEDQKIITPNDEAEKKGIRAFLANGLMKTGPGLLGSFLTLKGEYEPLVLTTSLFFRRVFANIAKMDAQFTLQQEAQEKARLEAVRAEAAKNGPPTPSPEAAALKAKVDAATAAEGESRIKVSQ